MTWSYTPATRSMCPPAELLAAAWLAGYSSTKTRRTYRTMLGSWFGWCATCDLDPLAARRAHVELGQRRLEQTGYAARTIALKLTAVASFCRYCEQEEVLDRSPMLCVRRPRIERLSPRGSLTRGQVHDLLAAVEALGTHPYGLCCVLAFNGLRIGEATNLDITDLDYDGFFPLLRLVRKGGRAGQAILARPTEAATRLCAPPPTASPPMCSAPRDPPESSARHPFAGRVAESLARPIAARLARSLGVEIAVLSPSQGDRHCVRDACDDRR